MKSRTLVLNAVRVLARRGILRIMLALMQASSLFCVATVVKLLVSSLTSKATSEFIVIHLVLIAISVVNHSNGKLITIDT